MRSLLVLGLEEVVQLGTSWSRALNSDNNPSVMQRGPDTPDRVPGQGYGKSGYSRHRKRRLASHQERPRYLVTGLPHIGIGTRWHKSQARPASRSKGKHHLWSGRCWGCRLRRRLERGLASKRRAWRLGRGSHRGNWQLPVRKDICQ